MNKVISFGCRLNHFEGKEINHLISKKNDVVVINSCAVTNEAERRVRQAIRKAKKENPNKKIIVTGCGAQINPDQFLKMNEVSSVVDNVNKLKKSTWENQDNSPSILNIFEDPQDELPSYNYDGMNVRENLVIQQGCNHRCTFCVIPYGRGNNRSFDPSYIIDQANKLVKKGVQEITLTGVDISDYGSDFKEHYCMSQLALKILNKTKIKRLRLSSIDCVELDPHFFDLLQNSRLMPHLHLSLQSGDDLILKRMKRRHLSKDIFKFIQKCKSVRPDITFGADIIAGFPTETEKMFSNTCELLKKCNITHLHIFPFSPKKNTPASKMPQLSKSVIKNRAKILRKLGNDLMEKLEAAQSKPRKILVEEKIMGHCIGYDQNYIKHQVPAFGIPIGEIITV